MASGVEREGRGGSERVTLDELIALNEEIAALVRAGGPLERGLIGARGDLKGRLGRVAGTIGRRMEQTGCSLEEALEAEGESIPELYRAVVAAGIRAGRLPAALEGMTTFARRLADLRTTIGLALIYPALVALLAYGLIVAMVVLLAPRIASAYDALGVPAGIASRLARAGEWAWAWGPAGLIVLILAAAAWVRSGRASALGGLSPTLGWMPGTRTLLRLSRSGLLAELLALLVENRVPLPDALRLAARAVGDDRLREAVARAAEATSRGEDLRSALAPESSPGLPPLLRWLVVSGASHRDLPGALRLAARTYHERALLQAELIRLFGPTALVALIGGTAVLLYGMTLFAPFAELLRGVAS
ncbi:type II secretion system F family protein [Tautonia sociabilis]|uniref:Type II secretory pathway, component PulF n=1 Tax=Tautonia sociabilis TaxID=2080755 RepID=A0A432MKX2_9BACT|nr:type II secretion system F family protein [Tautonia sociabilis]RUL88074.1 type II secretory pathway, component PulF [Tautonia sociabilis]